MRDYAKIATALWNSRKFRSLGNDDRAKLLYLYFHSCSQVNSVGCFSIRLGYVTADLMWGDQQVLEAINSLSEASLIDWNEQEEIIRIVSFVEHDAPTNPKHASAVLKVAFALHDSPQKLRVLRDLADNKYAATERKLQAEIDRLSIVYEKPIETPCPLSPSLTPIPEPIPSSLRSEGAGADPELPTFLPTQPWRDFLEMRKRIRKSPTARAKELLIKKLEQFTNQGHDPTEILENSIRNGWQDVYEPKNDRRGNGHGKSRQGQATDNMLEGTLRAIRTVEAERR